MVVQGALDLEGVSKCEELTSEEGGAGSEVHFIGLGSPMWSNTSEPHVLGIMHHGPELTSNKKLRGHHVTLIWCLFK